MSTHNICFHQEIKKYRYFFYWQAWDFLDFWQISDFLVSKLLDFVWKLQKNDIFGKDDDMGFQIFFSEFRFFHQSSSLMPGLKKTIGIG